MLSSLVQVREGYVRMGGWERFVLPDAAKSVVEGEDADMARYQQHTGSVNGVPGVPQQQWNGGEGGEEEEGEEEEDDEEDDVVFVMGQNGGEGMWSHEKRT